MFLSIRDAIVTQVEMPFEEVMSNLGLNALELWITRDDRLECVFGRDGSELKLVADRLDEVQTSLEERGWTSSALCLSTDFSSPNASAEVEWACRMVEAAYELGIPVVRIDTATANQSLTPAQVQENFIHRVQQVLQATSATEVQLAIENHGHHSNRVDFLEAVFEAVPDARLGLTLDAGNFYWYGYPLSRVYDIIEQFAARTHHTHVKNIAFPADQRQQQRPIGWGYEDNCCGPASGDLDWRRIVKILAAAGYRHDLCLENESLERYQPEQRLSVLQADVRALNEALCA